MVNNIVYFDTERDAERSRRKYKKYKATRDYKWVVQGNSLVRVFRR